MAEVATARPRAGTLPLVVLALVFPTIIAWIYIIALGGTGPENSLQQIGYAGGKVVQFALPIVYLVFVARHWPDFRLNKEGLVPGIVFGGVVAGAMLALYFGVLRTSPLLAGAPSRLLNRMQEFGVASGGAFLGLALFLCIAHSFLEEYYWRWFVFGQLRKFIPAGLAIVVASLGFMSHHVLILHAYLPDRILTGVVPASLAVAVGGVVWAWMYQRTGSLLAPWISHALVDAALFIIGWDMLKTAKGMIG